MSNPPVRPFPHSFAPTAAGYPSASAQEEVRLEVWLPRWRGLASWRSIAHLLREGRYFLPTSATDRAPRPYREAWTAVDAAHSVVQGLVAG